MPGRHSRGEASTGAEPRHSRDHAFKVVGESAATEVSVARDLDEPPRLRRGGSTSPNPSGSGDVTVSWSGHSEVAPVAVRQPNGSLDCCGSPEAG